MLGLAVLPIYLLVAGLCLWAAWRARACSGPARHVVFWAGLAAMFCLLAASRLFGLEEQAEAALRELLRQSNGYAGRRSVQGPVAAVLVTVFAGATFVLFAKRRSFLVQGPRRGMALAAIGAAGMVGLVSLRIVSFHGIDVLLYRGPHINRVIDPALALAVAAGAALFVRSLASGRGERFPRQRGGSGSL